MNGFPYNNETRTRAESQKGSCTILFKFLKTSTFQCAHHMQEVEIYEKSQKWGSILFCQNWGNPYWGLSIEEGGGVKWVGVIHIGGRLAINGGNTTHH